MPADGRGAWRRPRSSPRAGKPSTWRRRTAGPQSADAVREVGRDNGFSEIIENGINGSIIDNPADLTGLRDAIRFWSDSSRRDTARAANIARASHFDISKNVERTLDVLTRVSSG